MKNKIISIIVFFVLAYFLPLLWNLSLLFSIQIAVIFFISVILIATQPQLSINETNQTKRSDKFSVIGILLAFLISQIFSVVEWAYINDSHRFVFDSSTLIGIFFLACGTILRVSSIHTLGKFFTGTVRTQTNQKIITAGTYSFIRHPSYLGAYLVVMGSSVLLHAHSGIIVSAVVMFAAYYYRIKVEEETLVREFGEEYKSYQSRTKKLIPHIF